MVLKVFKIVIDEVAPEHKVHPTGVPLTGHVLVETDKTEDYKEIKVSLKGKGEVGCVEYYDRQEGLIHNAREGRWYRAKEEYFSKEVKVWKKSESPDGCFTAGQHSFPFEFTIPVGCPSSIKTDEEEIRAEICYEITAKIEQPGKDDKVKQTLKIVDFVDVNTSSLQNPVRKEKTKKVGFLCCASGSVSYTLEVAHTGFNVKGDKIPIQVHIENGSSHYVNMAVRLFQRIWYSADGKHRSRQETVLEKSAAIPANTTTDWSPSQLVIPDIPVTMKGPKIMKVEYVLSVYAESLYLNPTAVYIPVVIGNASLFRPPS